MAADGPSALTPREMEVLGRVSQGLQNKQIAYLLGMSESTVKVHVRNIMKKLDVRNRTQAAFRATELGPRLLGRPAQVFRLSRIGVWPGDGRFADVGERRS
jgi:DNA-binding CsgD family transcriptional regulator